MIYSNFEYLLFFPLVLLAYWGTPARWRTAILIVASYLFYASWNARFLFLILFSTLVDYLAGARIQQAAEARFRKGWLGVSLVANLGTLGLFKYFDFFSGSAQALLAAVGCDPGLPLLHLVLPVGISFYTFQSMSYTIDIYRRQLEPVRSFGDFLLFVAFFPQLVAGPIVRARDFLPQLSTTARLRARDVREGGMIFLIGFLKKAWIADQAALVADPVFADPGHFSSASILLAVLMYSLQIYCDFSGYSDMAIGSARLLGFRLPENFRWPYLAVGLQDFWHRWHITLSTWLRDYLYIPLGGSRCGSSRTYVNLLVTMVLGGLWHGAAWTFLAWGAVHGGLLAAERLVRRHLQLPSTRLTRVFGWAATFGAVNLAWVLFRAESMEHALTIYGGLLSWRGGVGNLTGLGLVLLGVAALMHTLQRRVDRLVVAYGRYGGRSSIVEGIGLATVVLLLLLLTPFEQQRFIYFQF